MYDYMRALRKKFYTPPGSEEQSVVCEAIHMALSPYPRGEAQRSGFAAIRRRSGMDELSALAGSEGYGACADAASGIYREPAQEPQYSFDRDEEKAAEALYLKELNQRRQDSSEAELSKTEPQIKE